MGNVQVWKLLNTGNLSKIEEIKFDNRSTVLNEISSRLPDGVYTTFRTFEHNKVLPLKSQFSRLEESANLLERPILLDRVVIRDALREVISHSIEQESRIRLTVDLIDLPGTLYISIETLVEPLPEDYKYGVNTVTQRAERNNPKAKQTSFLRDADAIRNANPENNNEVLLVSNKVQILEGLSSNFYAIKNGDVWTAGRQVLSGIIRSIILEEAMVAHIKVHLEPIYLSEINSIEEAFLTSASRSVLPIHKIDDQIIGTGKPGHITKQIMNLFQKRTQILLEEI